MGLVRLIQSQSVSLSGQLRLGKERGTGRAPINPPSGRQRLRCNNKTDAPSLTPMKANRQRRGEDSAVACTLCKCKCEYIEPDGP